MRRCKQLPNPSTQHPAPCVPPRVTRQGWLPARNAAAAGEFPQLSPWAGASAAAWLWFEGCNRVVQSWELGEAVCSLGSSNSHPAPFHADLPGRGCGEQLLAHKKQGASNETKEINHL